MMEISTPPTNPLKNESASDTLSEEDNLFYSSLKKDLDQIAKEPSSKSVLNILKYSKSL